MDLRDRAIGATAVVEFCIRQVERELADGRKKAAEADMGATVIESFDVAQIKARKLHRALEALRAELSASVGSPDQSRSGKAAPNALEAGSALIPIAGKIGQAFAAAQAA